MNPTESYLLTTLAALMNIDRAELSCTTPLDEQGVDSFVGLRLVKKIEKSSVWRSRSKPSTTTRTSATSLPRSTLAPCAPDYSNSLYRRMHNMMQHNDTPVWSRLSSQQRSRWFLYQLDGSVQGQHNNVFAARVHGALDRARLAPALAALAARHPMLRTCLRDWQGEPQQCVQDQVQIALHETDAAALGEEALLARVRADAVLPFALESAPLMRAHLYHSAPDSCVLMLVFDHLVCDGWSYWQVLTELGELLQGRDLPAQEGEQGSYLEFVEWQESLAASPA
ncbi:condensation domain-containing protein [Massilia sp. H-1]|nr:condensation domain-containing protein [Massilia sp. H-1]